MLSDQLKIKYLLLILLPVLPACYKYDKEYADYGRIKGSFVDKFTGEAMDYGAITLSPAQVVNGSLNLDSSGHFTNTQILPGNYTIYGAIPNGAAFSSDSAHIRINSSAQTDIDLKVEPWISIQNKVVQVTNNSVTIQYAIQGNKGLLPVRHAIFYATVPPVTTTSYQERPYFATPAAGSENGTFTFTITDLKPSTTYFIVAGARIATNPMNPDNNYNQGRQLMVTTADK